MDEFWFEVAAETNVVGQDGQTVIGKVRPGQRYKALAANDHWVTVTGPGDSFGYVTVGSVTRVPDAAMPPPPPVAHQPAAHQPVAHQPVVHHEAHDNTQPMPRVAAAAGQPPVLSRPITALGGALLAVAAAGIDFLTDTSPWDLPITFLLNPDSFDDGIGVGILLVVGAALVLGGILPTKAQTGLVQLGALVGLAAIVLLVQAFIRASAFGDFFSALGIGAWMTAGGSLLALYGAGKR